MHPVLWDVGGAPVAAPPAPVAAAFRYPRRVLPGGASGVSSCAWRPPELLVRIILCYVCTCRALSERPHVVEYRAQRDEGESSQGRGSTEVLFMSTRLVMWDCVTSVVVVLLLPLAISLRCTFASPFATNTSVATCSVTKPDCARVGLTQVWPCASMGEGRSGTR
jgi:hypothetical protein